MSNTGNVYRLSAAAAKDINDIYDYTIDRFGEQQAVKYLTGLDERLAFLAEYPDTGRTRDEVRKGLMSLVYQKHVVFYRVMQYGIRIVRVLHGSMDVPKQFGIKNPS